jgi:PKD repeat protein
MIDNKLKLLFTWLLFLGLYHPTYAQFGLPSEVCPNQNISFTSPNPSAAYHAWDFCTGDIAHNVTNTTLIANPTSVQRPFGFETVFDGTNWYGFLTDLGGPFGGTAYSLLRFDYGSSLSNTPTITNLGNIGGIVNKAVGLAIIKDNGNWYGLIANSGTSTVVRLSFGNSLTNTPTADAISDASIQTAYHLDLVYDGSKYVAVAANYGKHLTIIDFGNSMSNTPTFSTTANLPGTNLWSIRLTRGEDNNWYGLALSVGSGFYGKIDMNHLSFGSSINNTPTVTTLSNVTTTNFDDINKNDGIGGGLDLEFVNDGGRYYAFIVTNRDLVLKLDFGTQMSTPQSTLTNMGDLGVLNTSLRESVSISLAKDGSNWHLFVTSQTSNTAISPFIYRLDFANTPSCANLSSSSSTLSNPTNNYSLAGNYGVMLETYDADFHLIGTYQGNTNVVAGLNADFNSMNYCVGQPTSFTNTSIIAGGTTIESWTWDFGDASPTSSNTNAEHTYTAPGTYTVTLTPKSTGGSCDFPRTKTIQVRAIPEAKFSAPDKAGQNTTVNFVKNRVVQDEFALTSYYWLFDDGTFSILKTPSHSFSNPGIYNVTLTVKDTTDGCAMTYSKSVTVGATPTVDFSLPSNACTKTPITFNNTSSVSDNVGSEIVSYQWNFGGAGTSTEKNPTVTFDFASSYEISLTVTTNLGVTNTIKKLVSFQEGIQSSMQATSEVSGDAPLGVSFANQTSGAVSYLWDFGDGATSTDASPSHVFTQPGIYNVTFSAFGTNGCSIPVTQQVIVSASNTVTELGITNLRVQDDRLFVEITNNGNDPVISSNLKVVINETDTLTGEWKGVLNSLQATEYAFDLQQGQGDMVTKACAEIIDVNAQQDAKTLNNRLCKDLLDAQVVNALVQDGNCIMWLKNTGQIPVKKLKVKLDFGDTSQEVEWTGTLNTNEQTNYIVPLPMTEDELAGKSFFCANLLQVNGTQDAVNTNNVACQEYGNLFQVLGISPNPAIDYISIDYFLPSGQDNDVVQLQIINSNGTVMGVAQLLNLIAGRNTYKYPTAQLGSGVYTLVFIRGNRKVIKKVIIR